MHNPAPDHDHEHIGGAVGFYTGTIQELEVMRDEGQANEWAALLINSEEIVLAGRPNWLRFAWLSQQRDQQRHEYECIRKGHFS